MGKFPESITINVEPRIFVSEQTAETCLKILEAYINSHPDKQIIGHATETGEVSYEIADRL